MVDKRKNIEELFRDEFNGFSSEPSPSAWKNIRRKLFMNEFFSLHPGKFNIFYLVLIILSGLLAITILPGDEQKSGTISSNDKAEKKEVVFSKDSLNEVQEDETKIVPLKDLKTEVPEENEEQIVKITKKSVEPPTDSLNIKVKAEKPEAKTGVDTVSSEVATEEKEPVAGFIPSFNSGCMPLRVQFINDSENAVEYHWDFGDGGSSAEAEPSYIFDEPGTFTVSLHARSSNGEEDVYSREIRVFSPPEVNFEPDYHEDSWNEEPVYFYNYTEGAEKYLWDFGDGHKSDRKEPVHFYERPDNYDISLRAWSAEGCTDSLIMKDVFAAKEPEISFPTAFAPNMDGPTGGYYDPGEGNNMVFHPYTDDIPVEYNLKIFNRKGNLLFESNDYRTGWDGYYMQELQPQGVYIYKARGRFRNGKVFVEAGDVTLIWRRRY